MVLVSMFTEAELSGLVGHGIRFRSGRILVQTPLGPLSGLETRPHYEAPIGLRFEQVSICNYIATPQNKFFLTLAMI